MKEFTFRYRFWPETVEHFRCEAETEEQANEMYEAYVQKNLTTQEYEDCEVVDKWDVEIPKLPDPPDPNQLNLGDM